MTILTVLLNDHGSLFVIPCSGRKAGGGRPHLVGPSILDRLPDNLADGLVRARTKLRSKSHLDESHLLPAWQRYTGALYRAAHDGLRRTMKARSPIVIISGGYGLVVADEPIGIYNRRFAVADWPRGLLEDCLIALCESVGVNRIVAFCAQTTSYAELVRRVRWRHAGREAVLVSPDMGGRHGAQVLVPRAAGEALTAALDDRLTSDWRSNDGLEVKAEVLP